MSGHHTHTETDDQHARRDKSFRVALWLALVLNLAMFFVEITAGVLARSVSLQADAIDFFGDSANYSLSLFVLGMSLRARAYAALIKAASMGLFGLWVIGSALYFLVTASVPEPIVMGPVAILALIVNVAVAFLLYVHRDGDANRRSVWLCSRNDAISNVAVFAAAGLVWMTSSGWPDVAVALVMAYLSLTSAWVIFRQASDEIRRPDSADTQAAD